MYSGAVYMYFDGVCLSSKLRQQLVPEIRGNYMYFDPQSYSYGTGAIDGAVPWKLVRYENYSCFLALSSVFSNISHFRTLSLFFAVTQNLLLLLLLLPKDHPGIQFDLCSAKTEEFLATHGIS